MLTTVAALLAVWLTGAPEVHARQGGNLTNADSRGSGFVGALLEAGYADPVPVVDGDAGPGSRRADSGAVALRNQGATAFADMTASGEVGAVGGATARAGVVENAWGSAEAGAMVSGVSADGSQVLTVLVGTPDCRGLSGVRTALRGSVTLDIGPSTGPDLFSQVGVLIYRVGEGPGSPRVQLEIMGGALIGQIDTPTGMYQVPDGRITDYYTAEFETAAAPGDLFVIKTYATIGGYELTSEDRPPSDSLEAVAAVTSEAVCAVIAPQEPNPADPGIEFPMFPPVAPPTTPPPVDPPVAPVAPTPPVEPLPPTSPPNPTPPNPTPPNPTPPNPPPPNPPPTPTNPTPTNPTPPPTPTFCPVPNDPSPTDPPLPIPDTIDL